MVAIAKIEPKKFQSSINSLYDTIPPIILNTKKESAIKTFVFKVYDSYRSSNVLTRTKTSPNVSILPLNLSIY